jgi:DNA-binding transcriptional MerR regulator
MDGLSQDKATKILDADFQNIVKKVAAGRTLTVAERALIEARASGSTNSTAYAKNIVELANILGVTRRTLNHWRKMDGAPKALSNGQYDVSAWREFVRLNGLKGGRELGGANQEALKARRLLVDIEERELRLAIRRGEYLHREVVREAVNAAVSQLFAILHKRLEDELPPLCVGRDAVAIRAENAKALDEARHTAQAAFEAHFENPS